MSKTSLRFALILAVLALCCSAASATWLSDNFDSYINGNLVGQGGWTGTVGPMRVQSTFVKSGKAVEGNYLAWSNGDAERMPDSGSGIHNVEFDAAIDSACDSYGSNIGYVRLYEPGGFELTRFYFAHQQFKVLTAGAGQPAIVENTGNKVWYHILMRIDLMTSKMDVYVDGVQKLSQVGLYNPGASIYRIVIGNYNRGTDFTKAEMYVDNLLCQSAYEPPVNQTPGWTSLNRYRVILTADTRGVARDNSPASVEIDLPAALAAMGETGTFDESTIEVIGYDPPGAPAVFDSSRAGYEKYLIPWHLDDYYGAGLASLSFVMPSHEYTQYAVYFDTVESGRGKPQRYSGLVGDGDLFVEDYKRREINACHFDTFCDFDGDGDLDLFKGGVECFVYCYENVGNNRFVDAGRLSSGGSLFYLPGGEIRGGRSWVTVAFYDWDSDGDMDFFPSFQDGPYAVNVVYYENTTPPGGPLTYTDRGIVTTQSGASLNQGGWFPAPTFVEDWDGDGDNHVDLLVGTNNRCYLHRNVRLSAGKLIVDNGVAIQAGGAVIDLSNPRFDVADIDGDGDRDLFSGTQPGAVYFFENIDTTVPGRNPTFAAGRIVAFEEAYYIADAHSAVRVADFTGDGLLDFVVGRYWERSLLAYPEAPREYGWLYENDGSNNPDNFIKRDATNGATYTERFQICDAVRQNCVRAVDWNNDGKTDLVSGDTDGFIWLFQNQGNNLFPIFATGVKLRANGVPIALSVSGGHARPDICDWNNDGRKDMVVADGGGWVTLFQNVGTDAAPVLAAGQRVYAAGSPIDRGSRSSVLVCDWNVDGKKDLVFADQDNAGFYWFQNTNTDASPVFSAAQIIYFGGQQVTYVRPNLGDYVDFDGDGKKDFFGCQFESNIRLYKNIGSGGAGTIPLFSDPEGVMVVEPWSIMMTSGADVLDFNGDGDLDVLTGQGHGGGGLRFYERDYVDDFVNSERWPIVSVGDEELSFTATQVKWLPNGSPVTVVQGIVTACFNDFFYVESADRVSGIRVNLPTYAVTEGMVVDVRGTLGTTSAGERYIAATSVTTNL